MPIKRTVILCLWLLAPAAQAQLALHEKLTQAITVWTTPSGQRVTVAHCRYARMGCAKRLELLAQWIEDAADKHGVDPLVLSAIALHESGLNPFAQGQVGEAGIMQLHPRGVGRQVRFVKDERYRDRCKKEPGACQKEVIDQAATLLATATKTCGSVERALGYYNTGRCQKNGYAGRVMHRYATLSGLVP